MPAPALFPADWIRPADGAPADDLALAVLLVNSLDHTADPPDRLTSIDWFRKVLQATGHPRQAAARDLHDEEAAIGQRDRPFRECQT